MPSYHYQIIADHCEDINIETQSLCWASVTSNKCGLVSPPGPAIDLGLVQEQSRMEMLNTRQGWGWGWGCSRGGRAGSAPGFGLD